MAKETKELNFQIYWCLHYGLFCSKETNLIPKNNTHDFHLFIHYRKDLTTNQKNGISVLDIKVFRGITCLVIHLQEALEFKDVRKLLKSRSCLKSQQEMTATPIPLSIPPAMD